MRTPGSSIQTVHSENTIERMHGAISCSISIGPVYRIILSSPDARLVKGLSQVWAAGGRGRSEPLEDGIARASGHPTLDRCRGGVFDSLASIVCGLGHEGDSHTAVGLRARLGLPTMVVLHVRLKSSSMAQVRVQSWRS